MSVRSVGNSSVCGCYSPECASLGKAPPPPRPSLFVWGESSVSQHRQGRSRAEQSNTYICGVFLASNVFSENIVVLDDGSNCTANLF